MITKEAKKEILSRILENPEFSGSRTFKNLLTYLVEASIDGTIPKEYSIAVEVFNKDKDFNPGQDTTVRVYVHKLRKKLDSYYKQDGKRDKIRIEIPKGHYAVQFIKCSGKINGSGLFSFKKLQPLLIILLLLVVIYSQYQIFSLRESSSRHYSDFSESIFWSELENADVKKTIVLGDDFFFLENRNGEETIIRKHDINSLAEFKQYQADHPERELLEKTQYPFIPLISLKPLTKIMHLIGPDMDTDIKYSSSLTSTDLLHSNIVFFGSFRNLYILNQAIRDIVPDYHLALGDNTLTINTGDSLATFSLSGLPQTQHSDYCLFRKMPGPNHHTIILFISFFESGIDGAVDFITSPEYADKLEALFAEHQVRHPRYFEILFKTTGYSRTAFTTTIEYFREIDPELKIW